MKLLDKDGLTYYTGKVKEQLATKQPLIDNNHKLSYSLLSDTPNLSVYELSSNKVVSLSSSSTDSQYPSAKCVYDLVGDIESILETLDIGGGV